MRLGAGVAALAIAGVAGFLLLRREPPKASDARGSAAASTPAPQAAPPGAPAPTPPPVVRNAPEPAHVNATMLSGPPKHDILRLNHRPKPAPAKPSATPPNPPIANCNPNYYVDAQGYKHFKPECFLEK
jgi:hypothetical protein